MFSPPALAHAVRRCKVLILVSLALLTTAFAALPRCLAAELVDSAKSLRFAPADVAFYSASLRLEEQFDLFLGSRAYERLMQVPVVQLAKMQVAFQWQQSPEPTIAKVREYFQSPDGKQSAAILKEMFAEEVFVYGSQEWAAILAFVSELNGMSRQLQLDALISQQPPEQAGARLAEVLKEKLQSLEIPQTLLGFRLKQPERAVAHVGHLQTMIVDLIKESNPELQDLEQHIQREDIAGHPFVTLRLNGSQLPWDEMRSNSSTDVDDATFNEWRETFSRKQLVVAIGVVDEFLLVFVGNSAEPLENLGKGPLLADSAALALVKRHADQRLTSIGYASAELAASVNSPRANLEALVAIAESGLKAAPIEDARREQMLANITALVDNMATYLPQPGATSVAGFLTPRGTESFQYRSGTIGSYDSSQPLTLLDHADGNPFLMIAARSKQTVEQYDATVAAIQRVGLDFEELAEKTAPAEQWAEYQKWRPRIMALLESANTTTRENLYPAFADGQFSLVVDAAATSDHWVAPMPPAEKPLPMLEIGLVGSVADAARLQTAVSDYFRIVQETIALLHEANPSDFPDTQLPHPKVAQIDGGSSYQYDLPAEWGVDAQLVPNAILAEGVGVLSTFPTFSSRLVESKPFETDSPIDVRRPAAKVASVRFPQLLDAVRPWVDYGFAVAAAQGGNENDSAATMQAGLILPQVHQLLDVLAAVDSFTSVTYREDEVWVTHSELHFVDSE
jgi:hypothetical protein